jgi:hypothetical protein
MTNEKMLAGVMDIVMYMDGEERKRFDFMVNKREDFSDLKDTSAMLAEIVKQLREDIVKDEVKKAGRSSQLQAAKRILKSAVKTNKEALTYAPILDGRQCVCDGYRAVRLASPIDGLPELPKDMQYMDIKSIVKMGSGAVELELPDMAKLSAYIKIYKAEHDKKAEPATYDFGEHWQIVNAQYLLDMMILLPNAKAYAVKDKAVSPIYFEDDEGNDGLLCPVNPKNRVRARTEV